MAHTVAVADGALLVAPELYQCVSDIVPVGIDVAGFWTALAGLVSEYGPRNKELLHRRDAIQEQLDTWYMQRMGVAIDMDEYMDFLTEIGYVVPEGPPFQVSTSGVDPEISTIAGPQLVCPVDNARFALNAANARWGSLLDALYGTDVIPGEREGPYSAERGALVFERAEAFLDESFGLERPRFSVTRARFSDVQRYSVVEKGGSKQLVCVLADGTELGLAKPSQFVGYTLRGDPSSGQQQQGGGGGGAAGGELASVLLCHHDLHCEIRIDPDDPIGRTHPAGVKDIVLESAITTIMDFEDSVSAVDAVDKARCYANWAGLVRGDLSTTVAKGGQTITRSLRPDLSFRSAHGGAATLTLPGRSLLLVRNVGIHMYTDAVTTADGAPIPEGFLDALTTVMAAIPDIRRTNSLSNSRSGSVYVVKPKMHGPEEVAFVCEVFAGVEAALGLEPNTVKLGIMDEERRTTANLVECIRAAAERVVFINTGFLDRTGDEIHTSMEAGPMLPKAAIKGEAWLPAYEDWNVDAGLATGLRGVGQIGKGMWAAPDEMAKMLAEKGGHPSAGATTAWVPSPTAATLHAIHYHQVSVTAQQKKIGAGGSRANVRTILQPPLMPAGYELSEEELRRELDNNSQGILGYVVRWVDQGIGCSKVPDINNVGLMEDRATLRISSQHMANWLHHGVTTKEQVMESLRRMALVVDAQNADDTNYTPLAPAYENGIAFQAAVALVMEGRVASSGYTEPTLHAYRQRAKAGIVGASNSAVVTAEAKL